MEEMRVCMAKADSTYSFAWRIQAIASLTLLAIADTTIGIDREMGHRLLP